MSDAPLQVVALALFAEINARVDNGELRTLVLSEKGLTETEFQREQERWLTLIASQAQQQRWQLQQRYSTLYTQWRLKDNPSQTPSPPPPLLIDQPYDTRPSVDFQRNRATAEPTPARPVQVGEAPPFLEQPRSDTRREAFAQSPGFGAGQGYPAPQPSPLSPQPVTPAFLPDSPAFIPGLTSHERSNASDHPRGGLPTSANSGPLFVSPPHTAFSQPPATAAFSGPPLSFEQLTCLTAELDVKPGIADSTLAGYGIDRAGYAAQHQALRLRCQTDPELQQRYERLLQYYRGIVSQR
jgi:hypothetical protein